MFHVRYQHKVLQLKHGPNNIDKQNAQLFLADRRLAFACTVHSFNVLCVRCASRINEPGSSQRKKQKPTVHRNGAVRRTLVLTSTPNTRVCVQVTFSFTVALLSDLSQFLALLSLPSLSGALCCSLSLSVVSFSGACARALCSYIACFMHTHTQNSYIHTHIRTHNKLYRTSAAS